MLIVLKIIHLPAWLSRDFYLRHRRRPAAAPPPPRAVSGRRPRAGEGTGRRGAKRAAPAKRASAKAAAAGRGAASPGSRGGPRRGRGGAERSGGRTEPRRSRPPAPPAAGAEPRPPPGDAGLEGRPVLLRPFTVALEAPPRSRGSGSFLPGPAACPPPRRVLGVAARGEARCWRQPLTGTFLRCEIRGALAEAKAATRTSAMAGRHRARRNFRAEGWQGARPCAAASAPAAPHILPNPKYQFVALRRKSLTRSCPNSNGMRKADALA